MEKTDLNNAGAVDQQDLNKADSVNQQDLNNDGSVDQQEQDGKLADGTDENKTVKYADLKKATDRVAEESKARKAAEEQAAYAQRMLELLQANQPQQTQQQAGSTYEQAMIDLGITTDDLYDGANIVKVQNRKAVLDTALQQQQSAFTATKQFVASHSDFTQVVGSVNPTTGFIVAWSQEALSLQQKKPWLAGAFQSAQGAYEAVMQERKLTELETKAAVNQEHLNRQDIDNASLPLGASAAGGGGAGDPQNQRMMTREEVIETERKLANGEEVS